MSSTSISWLHLTDIHMGMGHQESPLLSIRDKLFTDLEKLYDKCGPWDLVIFTGDLTQRGTTQQFNQIDQFLRQLWNRLNFQPKVLAVPGNHDLERPKKKELQYLEGQQYTEAFNYNEALDFLENWDANPQKQKSFWEDQNSLYRQVINKIFKNYSKWWEPYKPTDNFNQGILPGEFSYIFAKDGVKLGIVGLNSTWLQLGNGNYERKLVFEPTQFHQACGGDGPRWINENGVDACILLTHHPVEWWQPNSQLALREIISDYFKVNLCGHLHEAEAQVYARGGTYGRRTFQGRSLFGREIFNYYQQGDNGQNIPQTEQRLHGYNVGRIEFNGGNQNDIKLVFWPRQARKQGDIWAIVPDYSFELKENILPTCIVSIQEEFRKVKNWKILHEHWQTFATRLINCRCIIPNGQAKTGITEWECLRDDFLCTVVKDIVFNNTVKKTEKLKSLENIDHIVVKEKVLEQMAQAGWEELIIEETNKQAGILDEWSRRNEKIRLEDLLNSLQLVEAKSNAFLKFIDQELKKAMEEFEKKLSQLKNKSIMSEAVVLN